MKTPFRPAGRVVVLALSVASLAACGDANLRKLNVGMARDSVLKVLGQGSVSSDSTPNVYREERYLYGGQMITMLLYTNTGKEEGVDTLPERELIPVVLRNDTLTGWGWEHHDSVARAINVEIKPREK